LLLGKIKEFPRLDGVHTFHCSSNCESPA
jgi:hypothetical protein